MNYVTIGFSRRKKFNLLSWLIQKVERTNFSHTWISWKEVEIDRRKIYEAIGTGVREIGSKRFKEVNLVVAAYVISVNDEVFLKMRQEMCDNSGLPYSTKNLIGLGIMRVVNFVLSLLCVSKKIGNPFKDGKYSLVCVEAGARILEEQLGEPFKEKIEDIGLREYKMTVSLFGRELSDKQLKAINGLT